MSRPTHRRGRRLPKLLYADAAGNIYDHPTLTMAGMSGNEPVLPAGVELIPRLRGTTVFFVVAFSMTS